MCDCDNTDWIEYAHELESEVRTLQQRILELEQRNKELSATVERLRDLALSCGTVRADEFEAVIESTPQQNLNAVKRDAFIEGFMFSGQGFNGELYNDGWSKVVELFDTELQIKYPSGEE